MSVLDRPIQHLYLLEVVSPSDPAPEKENVDRVPEGDPAPEAPRTRHPRPRRSAAEQACARILAQAISGTDFEL